MEEKMKKTTLFLCNCGVNISNSIDMEAVRKWAMSRRDVSIVESHDLLCSADGKKFFSDKLTEEKPDRVIIAACSPKKHEKTFQDLAIIPRWRVSLPAGGVWQVQLSFGTAPITAGKVSAAQGDAIEG